MTDKVETNSRAAAANLVTQWLRTGVFPLRLITDDVPDRAFVTEVLLGITRWKRFLDWVIRERTRARPSPAARAFLYVGLYQILLMDTVPVYAAVNETVRAARRGLPRALTGLVNALLRRASEQREEILSARAGLALGLRESHPDEMLRRWARRFGEERTEALCRHNNTRARVVVRPNGLRTTPDAYADLLRAADIAFAPHPFAPNRCFVLDRGTHVRALPGYAEGLFAVQDPSTLCAVDLLAPQPGEFVIDACAAPGGKTALIAEAMGNRGEILATDSSDDRLAILRDNVGRLGLDGVRVCRCNAARKKELIHVCGTRMPDRILLDAPCTNTGVLRRRPDARWRFSKTSLKSVCAVQAALLDSLADILKPGGTLVFSTCSVEAEEGGDGLAAWLQRRTDFRLQNSVALFPPDQDTDGIYAAALVREPAPEPGA